MLKRASLSATHLEQLGFINVGLLPIFFSSKLLFSKYFGGFFSLCPVFDSTVLGLISYANARFQLDSSYDLGKVVSHSFASIHLPSSKRDNSHVMFIWENRRKLIRFFAQHLSFRKVYILIHRPLDTISISKKEV